MKSERFSGDKLRLIRLFHGLSQEQLGETVAASRQYIQQLETGAKFPSKDLTLVLAESLEVYPEFFTSALENDVKEEQCHFRKQRTTPASTIRQVISHGTFFDMVVTTLSKLVNFPPIDFPFKKFTSLIDIEEIAESCRKHWGLGISAPIKNVTRVLENAGAIVTTFDSISNKLDALSINRARPIIVLNSDKEESPARIRFDLAHECGHLILHPGIETGDYKTEEEANRFASAFLLPRKAFAEEFPRSSRLNWIEIYKMKLRWKVSVRAIIRRAADLKLIDPIQYRVANIHLSKSGQTKYEKYDECIEKEPAEVMKIAIETLETHLTISISDIGHKLDMKPNAISKLLNMPLKATPVDKQIVDLKKYKTIKSL